MALAVVVIHHGDSDLVELGVAVGTVLWQIAQTQFVSPWHEMMSNETASLHFPVVSRPFVQVEIAILKGPALRQAVSLQICDLEGMIQ